MSRTVIKSDGIITVIDDDIDDTITKRRYSRKGKKPAVGSIEEKREGLVENETREETGWPT